MAAFDHIEQKIQTLTQLQQTLARWRAGGELVVFTNGCFDLLHVGHLRYLTQARALGAALCVGVNSDESVRRLKGPQRPVVPQAERAEMLRGLRCVDYVEIFGDDTPLQLILALRPDILVKGGDWLPEAIVGRREVESWGGRVLSLPYVEGHSSSELIRRSQTP